MVAIQEISARMAVSPARASPATLSRALLALLLYPIVGLLLLANMINLGADLGAMAAAVNLLVGGPVGLYVVAFAVGCTWLEIFSRYQRYVSVLKWGSFALLAYVAVAFAVHAPWGRSSTAPRAAFSLNIRTTSSPLTRCWAIDDHAILFLLASLAGG